LSIEVGGLVPALASFCQVKIIRNVVPARAGSRLIEALCHVLCKLNVPTRVAPVNVVELEAGVPATGVTEVGAVYTSNLS
jgi:hypothetical protein